MSRLLSIGDQVESGLYRFHSRFNRACNFERNGRLISVVDEGIGPGPINIVVQNLNARPMAGRALRCPPRRAEDCAPYRAAPLEITGDTVIFEGLRFRFTGSHRYDSRVNFQPHNPSHFHRNLATFGELLKKTSPPKSLAFLLDDTRLGSFRSSFERAFAAQIRGAVDRVFHGRLLEGVRSLKGCGLGLTPSGDDFIAGLLFGLHLLQKWRGRDLQPIADMVFSAAQGANIFSNTFLELARRGLLFGRLKELIQALLTGSELSLRRATERLLAVGASSGADLATGFFMTLQGQSGPAEQGQVQSFL